MNDVPSGEERMQQAVVPRSNDQSVAQQARDRRTTSLLDALSAVEDRLDPVPAKRGQRIADIMTVAAVGVAVAVSGFPIERPLLLVALFVLGTGVTRLARHAWSYRLRKERERLLEELERGPPPSVDP